METTVKEVKARQESRYRRAKTWQIGAFALNNTATNIFLYLMMFVSYYATGVVGLGTVIVSTLITMSRMWDGITDPIIGLWIDKTDGKMGKFRPFMIMGWVVMTIITLLMFFTTHLVPENMRLIYFIILYLVYIVGYTFQTACTKAGQTVLTNDPEQRPLFSTFDMSYTSLLFAGAAMYVSNYMVPKHGGFTESFFHEFVITVVIASGVMTAIAVAGLWEHDRTENFGTGGVQEPIKLKDMFNIIKGNRPLQMLIVAASTDKLASTVSTNSIVMVMLFGILIGDYGVFGSISAITMIPVLILIQIGTRYARKFGSKKALVVSTWMCIALYAAMFLLLWLGDPSQIRMTDMNAMSIAFVTLYILATGVRNVSGGIVIPMIPDITDYELYKNDRYAPGVMGTIFSFVDKMISSLGQTIIGILLAYIGFKEVFPSVDTPPSEEIFWVTMFLFVGMMILGWVASLIAMKFYELDDKRMAEIQMELADRRDAKKAAIEQ